MRINIKAPSCIIRARSPSGDPPLPDGRSCHAGAANPARRLYERHRFRVVETRTDADYERYSGVEGRVLMVKELA